MPEITVCDEHGQVYDLWRRRAAAGLRVVHVDFHCDMRGLLIDRGRQRVRFLTADGRIPRADSGNYLGVAMAEGIVAAVRWVHDRHGGRRYDAGTVKYVGDLSLWPGRIRRPRHSPDWTPCEFEEVGLEGWDGPAAGDHLDIDWDGLASIDYPRTHSRELVERFLAAEWSQVPAHTYLAKSPGYSDPDPEFFEEFVERLAEKLGARVTRLPPPSLPEGYPKPPQDLRRAERIKYRAVLALHRAGIY